MKANLAISVKAEYNPKDGLDSGTEHFSAVPLAPGGCSLTSCLHG